MKITELSNEFLKYMIKEYSSNQKDFFDWDTLSDLYPTESDKIKSDALCKLYNDGMVNLKWYDNLPKLIALNIDAIIAAEQDTTLNKIYRFLKEVREWL